MNTSQQDDFEVRCAAFARYMSTRAYQLLCEFSEGRITEDQYVDGIYKRAADFDVAYQPPPSISQ